MQAPINGGTVVTLTSSNAKYYEVAVGDTGVFWFQTAGGQTTEDWSIWGLQLPAGP